MSDPESLESSTVEESPSESEESEEETPKPRKRGKTRKLSESDEESESSIGNISELINSIKLDSQNIHSHIKEAPYQNAIRWNQSLPRAEVLLPLTISMETATNIQKLKPPKNFKSPVREKKSTSPFKINPIKKWELKDFEDIIDEPEKLILGRSNAAEGEQGYSIEDYRKMIKAINARIAPEKIMIPGSTKISYVNAIRRFFDMDEIPEPKKKKGK